MADLAPEQFDADAVLGLAETVLLTPLDAAAGCTHGARRGLDELAGGGAGCRSQAADRLRGLIGALGGFAARLHGRRLHGGLCAHDEAFGQITRV